MRLVLRAKWVVTMLVAACALAPAAHAAVVKVDDVSGQIYDVDATRILFYKSTDELGVKNRLTQEVTTIAAPSPRHVSGGFLTPHGVIFGSYYGTTQGQLHEVYDGTMTTLFTGQTSLEVDGHYAIWTGPDLGYSNANLYLRDLTTPPVPGGLPIAADSLISDHDVAPNGDVVYATHDFEAKRYRSGTTETLAAPDQEFERETGVLTDGVNALWRESNLDAVAIRGQGPDGAFTLANTDRNSALAPGADYRAAAGWIAFTRGEWDHTEVWLRSPAGEETQVSGGSENRLLGLADDGDVVYVDTTFPATPHYRVYLYRPGPNPPVEITGAVGDTSLTGGSERVSGDVFKAGGRWWSTGGNALNRFAAEDLEQGAKTTIGDHPTGDDNPSHASVAFSADESYGAATFQCSVDSGAFAACDSPLELTGLQHGQHTVVVRAVREDGGEYDTDPASVAWRVESTPPAVTMPTGPGDRTSDATPTFGGAAGTATEDEAKVTLEVFDGDRIIDGYTPLLRTVQVTPSGGSWSATVGTALPDGEYTARAKQVDAAGNVGLSAPMTFVVDTTPPYANLSSDRMSPLLTGETVHFDAAGSSDAAGGSVVRYEWDLDGDGDFERDTGSTATTSKTYQVPHQVSPGVRVTDSVGNTDVARLDFVVAPKPPPGLVGVTINDGDRFTNVPDVFVHPVWPRGATNILLSNDGGFRDPVTSPLASNLPWRLDSSGPERLPKTIYARFDPNGTTYQDDIILDETPPALLEATITKVDPRVVAASARERIYHLRLKARDRTAGVNRMQITTNRRHPGPKRTFHTRVKFKSTTFRIFVRVRDRAGNWSHWKLCSH